MVMPKRRAKRGEISFPGVASISKARQSPFPSFIENSDPTLRAEPPSGHEWVFEIKIDGYRGQLYINGGKIVVYSRSDHGWTAQFAPIAEAARALRARNAVIDGEVTVMGKTGHPDFQALRRELGKPNSKRLTFNAFDLLYLDGMDLRPAPYSVRKTALKALLADVLFGMQFCRLNAKLGKSFRVFKGIESDILADGSLDYPDHVLARFDFVVASVHGLFRLDRAAQTNRILRAVANPHTPLSGT